MTSPAPCSAGVPSSRFLTHQLYEVSHTDPLTLGLVPLVLTVEALLASWLPARRAARIDPVVTLREE